MLKDLTATACLPVKDLERARRFYEDVLGLEPVTSQPEGPLVYRTGQTTITVYPSEYAGTNQANAVAWDTADETEALVAALKARGVAFEHYDLPGLTLDGDLHRAGDYKLAWFKDPDGNILHLVGR